eukprot:gnl/TRDRNA2_/TRDRNA2_196687_c0_seq1.p1 gnl/TRDRNA2_/TRDRNA2_196687_c0~~gnl/TRDRNA2_/TRDRNA2_196687_c0_seq1.p1  ORF type:complete len:121 (-),score=28.12 gnl/TRDRNA2_/TRDRNA2_196687_c0_seq1:87-449(-)
MGNSGGGGGGLAGALGAAPKSPAEQKAEQYAGLIQQMDSTLGEWRDGYKDKTAAFEQVQGIMEQIKGLEKVDGSFADAMLKNRGITVEKRQQMEGLYKDLRQQNGLRAEDKMCPCPLGCC